MAAKLDIGLALKLIKPFDGSLTQLTSYIESVELLKDYAEGVPEADLIKFLKTTLEGAAHGTIDGVATVEAAFEALKKKFAIKITPKAVENEMHCKKQSQKSITDFGSEIEKLAAKLASAHVSTGTFIHEAAASSIVEPIAVKAFIDGLKDPSTKFFLKARNPPTLNKAISDALECQPSPGASNEGIENMMALWCSSRNSTRGFYRGYDRRPYRSRGYDNRGRGNSRGRGYYSQQNQNQQQQYTRGYYRGQYQRYPTNYRGRGHPVNLADATPQQQQQIQQQQPQQQHQQQQRQPNSRVNPPEEANLIDLFR